MPGHSRSKNGVLMHAYAPGIHVFPYFVKQGVDGRDIRAFTPVFDGLCPAMTAFQMPPSRRNPAVV
jgi:hypothetical protein